VGFGAVIIHDGFIHPSRAEHRRDVKFLDDHVPWRAGTPSRCSPPTAARCGGVVDEVVELRDVTPTLLDLAGVPGSCAGKSPARFRMGHRGALRPGHRPGRTAQPGSPAQGRATAGALEGAARGGPHGPRGRLCPRRRTAGGAQVVTMPSQARALLPVGPVPRDALPVKQPLKDGPRPPREPQVVLLKGCGMPWLVPAPAGHGLQVAAR
jgi:hypothetical protein